MIRLRGWINVGLEHRWLGFLVLALLVVLLFLVASHSLSDAIIGSVTLVCMTVVALLTQAVTLSAAPTIAPRKRTGQRDPPTSTVSAASRFAKPFAERSISLRR